MSIINGVSYPVVKLFDPRSPGEPRFTLNLPLTNSGGLVETYSIRKISHELINPDPVNPQITTAEKVLGYSITFTLHYERFIDGNDLYNTVKKIFEASKSGWEIKLTPRSDAPWREFTVLFANNSFELGVNKGGLNAKFHRLPVIVFTTKSLEPELKWFPPGFTEPGGGEFIPISGSPG